MNMILTGGSGFIGTAFVRAASGYFDIVQIRHDLTKRFPNKLPGADVVVHMAALTAKSTNDTSTPEMYRRVNVLGTKHLLAGLSALPTYFLYISTMDVVTIPLSPYAKSKLAAEALVTAYCTTHAIPFGIARLGSVYGPGEGNYGKIIPTCIRAALAGKPMRITAAKQTRRFIYVDDVAKIITRFVQKKQTGIVNVVGDTEISVADVATITTRIMQGRDAGNSSFVQGLKKEIAWFRNRKTIIFDVDGTILHHQKRVRQVRRTYRTRFARRAHIESPRLLALDTLVSGIIHVLSHLHKNYRLIAVSSRQSEPLLALQLHRLGVARFFEEIIAVGPVHPIHAKQRAFSRILKTYCISADTVIAVGDSDVEKTAAQTVGIRFIHADRMLEIDHPS